jgi:21S rRNA (GM2251-2'-O)-methyltransferase
MRATGILRFRGCFYQLAKKEQTSTFDRYFPKTKERRKAWEGQDKDQYFKDRFAHVHVRQRQRQQERGDKRKPDKNVGQRRDGGQQRKSVNKGPPRLERSPLQDYLYGTGPVLAALEAGRRAGYGALYVSRSEGQMNERIMQLAGEKEISIKYDAEKRDLNALTNNGVHNGYVLETRPLVLPDLLELSGGLKPESTFSMVQKVYNAPTKVDGQLRSTGRNAFGVYIDQVTDTHNIGAIIRSAYFLGADFLVMSEKNCAKLNAVVAKASAGALDLLPLYNAPKPLDFFKRTAQNNWNVVASLPDINRLPANKRTPLSQLPQLLEDKPTLMVFGSEGEGLRRSLIDICTHGTSLKPPTSSDVQIDSLNVSVAAALLISHFHLPTAFD